MQRSIGIVVFVMMLAGEFAAKAQPTAGPLIAQEKVVSAAAQVDGQPGGMAPDTRTEKQKALATQVDRLFNMATDLKVQVDKTNKNILSLKVVEKAQEIEALAKGMRGQLKR